MKKLNYLALLLVAVLSAVSFSSCSDDDDVDDKELDGCLFGEWVEMGGNRYVHDYYCFYSDGTGTHGSWESDIDWVNEDDDIKWYTVDDEYLYINGARYEYSCDGSILEINMNGRVKRYREL